MFCSKEAYIQKKAQLISKITLKTVSGKVPKEPVVSLKSGHVFEKSLILKFLKENGNKDPLDQTRELTVEDLITVHQEQTAVEPKPPSATSIPSLLVSLQNEWDATMLEVFTLKQQYMTLRQELSNALYENDAAKRVIARLVKERDEARKTLEGFKGVSGAKTNGHAAAASEEAMDVDENTAGQGVPSKVAQTMDAKSAELSQGRRKRKPGPEVVTQEALGSFKEVLEVPSLHSAANSGGILSLDVLRSTVQGESKDWALTGGKDGHAILVDCSAEEGEVLGNFKIGTKKLHSVLWSTTVSTPDLTETPHFFTGSADKTVKCWSLNYEDKKKGGWKASNDWTYKGHGADVVGLAMQASGQYLAACSSDGSWSYLDIEKEGSEILKIKDTDSNEYTALDFHPDGLLLATGTSQGTVQIWDVKSASNVQSLTDFNGQEITSMSFSENGYYFATGLKQNVVKLWDLRKLTNFHTIELAEGNGVAKVRFDPSAQYLGVAYGNSLRSSAH